MVLATRRDQVHTNSISQRTGDTGVKISTASKHDFIIKYRNHLPPKYLLHYLLYMTGSMGLKCFNQNSMHITV
jgi:hypothetical protein